MKMNKEMVDLICRMEYMIGHNCYNPNSYDGCTGDEGCNFRYPVHYYNKNGSEQISKLVPNVNSDNIHTLKYKFGSNHLYVGKGIIEILDYLENIYDIDFNELEKNRNKNFL